MGRVGNVGQETSRCGGTQAGMTLIEVMMAAGIIAFAMSAIYSGFVSMAMLADINKDRAEAVGVVSSLIEEIQAMDFNAVLEYVPPDLTSAPGVDHWVEAQLVIPADEAVEEEGGGIVGDVVSELLDAEPDTEPLPAEGLDVSQLPNPSEVKITLFWEDRHGRVYQFAASTKVGR